VHMKRIVVGVSVAAVAAVAAVACSSSSSPATTGGEDGGPDATAPEPDTGTPGADTGTAAPDSGGGVACASGATLYARLGGHDGIRKALDAIVANELMDPDIASYFFNQVANPIPAGHPNADQITECFTILLSGIAGGPYTYPPDGGVTDDAGTFQCRDMATIHQPLLISGGTFDKFISIAAATLSPSVCTADLTTIGAALEGTRTAIVTSSLADAGLEPFPGTPPGPDAGDQ
jgi:hypothetical protein